MTPAAALGRHIEWLEFALAAARSEETWRAARLDKATKRNRVKRTDRLAEVRDEIAELAALLDAIRGLQARAARPKARRGGRASTGGAPRRRAAASAGPSAGSTDSAAGTAAAGAAAPATTSLPRTRGRRTTSPATAAKKPAEPAGAKPTATPKPKATPKSRTAAKPAAAPKTAAPRPRRPRSNPSA